MTLSVRANRTRIHIALSVRFSPGDHIRFILLLAGSVIHDDICPAFRRDGLEPQPLEVRVCSKGAEAVDSRAGAGIVDVDPGARRVRVGAAGGQLRRLAEHFVCK